jgi:hypothetical protein
MKVLIHRPLVLLVREGWIKVRRSEMEKVVMRSGPKESEGQNVSRISLNSIYELSPYRKENTALHRYRGQPVNAV